jgi:hypothetical protein
VANVNLTVDDLIAKAAEHGYDIETEGKGKRAMHTAIHRETGKRLCPAMGANAAMRILMLDANMRYHRAAGTFAGYAPVRVGA